MCHNDVTCIIGFRVIPKINGIAVIVLIQAAAVHGSQHPVVGSGEFYALVGVALENVEPVCVNISSFALVFPAEFFCDQRLIHCRGVLAVLLEPEFALLLGQSPLVAVHMQSAEVNIRNRGQL